MLPIVLAPLVVWLGAVVAGFLVLDRTEITGPVVVIALSLTFTVILGRTLVRAYRNPFPFPPSARAPVLARIVNFGFVAIVYLVLTACAAVAYYLHPGLRSLSSSSATSLRAAQLAAAAVRVRYGVNADAPHHAAEAIGR